MAETKLINFRYGTYDEINGLGKDANCIYFAIDKPLFYAVGKWQGIASMTSEVDRANSKTILKINGDGGYAINCEIEGETLSKDLKEKLINAYEFVQLISGEDEDAIINKWNEIVAFLQGFGEADKLLNVVVELQNNLADEVANRISADQKHTEDIKSITDLVNDMFTLVDKGDGTKYIQSKYGFASDSFISARGVDNESSGVGGLDAQAVWDLLMQNDDATKIINVSHIPDITVAKITDFTAKVGDLIANKADKATTLSGYGITDAVTLNTAQTISGEKTFSFGYSSTFSLKSTEPNLTIDVNTIGSWTRGLKWANSSVENYGYSLLGTYGSGIDILYMYMGFDGEAITSNPSFRFYKGGKLTHKTLDVQESAHANMIANLNAEMVGGMHASDLTSSVIYPRKLDGILIKSKAKFSHNRHNIVTIKGANYAAWDKPYFTIVEFYSFVAEGGFYNVASSNIGHKIPEIKIFTIDDSVYIWFKHGMFQTFVVDWNCSDILGNNVESITNSAFPTEGVSRLVTTTPINVAYENSNVASATKLETSRTIWGQSFDGTKNISGALYLGTNPILGNDNINILNHSAYGYLELGYEVASKGYSTYINGNSIHFRYSTEHKTGILISSNGNVAIGAVSPTAKLHVNGDSIIDGNLTVRGNQIKFKTPSMYIGANDAQIYFQTNFGTALVIENMAVRPSSENGTLGTADKKWQGIYTKAITIGNASITWDDENQCLRVNTGIASDSFLSAKGIDTTGNGQGGGGGFDAHMLWNELTIPSPTNTGKTIMLDLLPDMPTNKVTDFANQVKALITVENIPTLTSAKISDFNTAVATAMSSTLSDISANLSNHEQRLQAIERALTWQGI